MKFLKADIAVFSNAKNYRQDSLTPLIVPTVNLSHFDVIPHQRKHYGLDKGFLVCNSNCAVIGLVIPFAAIEAAFGPIDIVSVVTEQALSGAGHSGVSAMDIKDSVIPYISGEEEKMQPETRKILGTVNRENTAFINRSDLRVSATCTRVDVTDGHMAFVSLKFAKRPPPTAEKVKKAMKEYVSEAQHLGCPSAPENAITVMEEPNRPQPRLDRDADRGYSVSVGRIREDPSGIFDLQFAALSHNSSSFPRIFVKFLRLTFHSCHWRSRLVDTQCGGCGDEGSRLALDHLRCACLAQLLLHLITSLAIFEFTPDTHYVHRDGNPKVA